MGSDAGSGGCQLRPRWLLTLYGSKRSEKLTYFVVSFQGMPERKLGVELIAVAPSVALTREIAICDEFGDDALGGALGDPHLYCDIAQSHPGVLRNAQQNVCVISEKGPCRHRLIIDDTRSAIHASVSAYWSACIDGLVTMESRRFFELQAE